MKHCDIGGCTAKKLTHTWGRLNALGFLVETFHTCAHHATWFTMGKHYELLNVTR